MKNRFFKNAIAVFTALSLVVPGSTSVFAGTKEVKTHYINNIQAASETAAVDLDAFGDLPEKFDLREEGVVTPVKFQNPFGTCWAFGVCAAAESSILSDLNTTYDEMLKNGLDMDLSEKQLAWWLHNPVPAGDTLDPTQVGEGIITIKSDSADDFYEGGSASLASSIFASGVGPTLESAGEEYKYEFLDAEGNKVTSAEDIDKIVESSWKLPESSRSVYSFQLKNENILPVPVIKHTVNDEWVYDGYNPVSTIMVKTELIKGRGVAMGYLADRSRPGKPDPHVNTDKWAQYNGKDLIGDHMVCIVGWDDTFPKSNFTTSPPEDGAWIVKNSWNTDYGNNGYFYLSYYDHTICALESFDFDLTDKSFDMTGRYIDQYDLMPSDADALNMLSLESSTNELLMANVYTAKRDVGINSVGIVTSYPYSKMTVELYKLGDGKTIQDLTSEDLVDKKSEVFTFAGNHRIYLNDTYYFRKDSRYVLVAKEQCTDTNGRQFVIHANVGMSKKAVEEYNARVSEGQQSNEYYNAVVNEGESFVNYGNGWVDWAQDREKYSENGDLVIDNFTIKGYGVLEMLDTPVITKAKGRKGAIQLEWTPVEGAADYLIQYGTNPDYFEHVVHVTASDKCKKTIKVKGKKTYNVIIMACARDDEGTVIGTSHYSEISKVKVK